MDHETVEPPAQQGSTESTAEILPPDSSLPQPGLDWLEQAGNVSAEPPPVSSNFTGRQNQPAERTQLGSRDKRIGLFAHRSSMKAITAFGIVGIVGLIYLQSGSDKSAAADMLGTELVKLVPEFAPVPRSNQGPVDPRLADPVALDMLRLENEPLATRGIEPVATESLMAPKVHSEETPAAAVPPAERQAQTQLPATERANAPGIASSPANDPVNPASAPGLGVTNEELMLRLQRLELLLAQLQLQAKANAAVTPAAATPPATPSASSPAVAAPTPAATQRRVEPAARPSPARTAKTTASRPVKQAKAQAPATKPAPVLGGQLVSVDMWNGEASVVIASGLPGDRRVRVLRPGDVVNGMALRSADPVTRSATFVAPGSQGLTLYVSQGG